MLDTGERYTTTDAAGNYVLRRVGAGTHVVRIVSPTGRVTTTPASAHHRITPTSGQVLTGRNFGIATVPSGVALATRSG